jgi:ABC-type dipeptide/oligopeptide/nickel transport system permease subunit
VLEHYALTALSALAVLGLLAWQISRRRSTSAWVGLALLLPLLLSPTITWIAGDAFNDGVTEYKYERFVPPGEHGGLGTDARGRDVFQSAMVGGANTWAVTAVALLVAVILSLIFGLLAASERHFLSWLAGLVMQFFEVFPFVFFLAITLAAYRQYGYITDTAQSSGNAAIFVGLMTGLISMPYLGRVIERLARQEMRNPYIMTLHSSGVPYYRILWRNILLNNILPSVMLQISLLVGVIILMSSAVDYILEIGFGDYGQTGILSLGKLLAHGRQSMVFGQGLWAVLTPAFGILISVLGGSLMVEGLTRRKSYVVRSAHPKRATLETSAKEDAS